MKARAGPHGSHDSINYYTEIRNQLERISLDRARDACIRSKVRWHECGARSSKYFLNLEKRNYENIFITRITKDNESCITDPNEILENKGNFIAKYIPRRIRESTIVDLDQNTRR